MSFSFLQESQKAKALAKKNNIVEPTPYARKLSTDQLNSLLKRFPHPYPKSKRVWCYCVLPVSVLKLELKW